MMMTYLFTHLAACALGYGGRVFLEWRQQRHRERLLRALGGKLPDWEEQARALESTAHLCLSEMTQLSGATHAANTLRAEADITRRRGRRRDREWL